MWKSLYLKISQDMKYGCREIITIRYNKSYNTWMFKVLRTQDEGAINCMEEPKKYFIQDLTLDGYLKLSKQRKWRTSSAGEIACAKA